ncbi:CysB family HTH-type transcriptional regulator [Fluviibacter phosphoraccumulans]|uniref:CysB family transcriptional regulator n=1 Tax=Fluviibacter phosphoraccumulans TaxID=1751046 RepID=A0A7R6TPK6_9RHOO|nr:CysB family HTH-type transcriptional regulator [Fluviibacter phosphoraccumulans]BBU69760.1 CysB family transcriptional regulator [Fluviibacter phosphoraccumulans]BBU71057.1 CysB family transcriptional regulator [Fluviibacter phosphoraccumulans]
MNFQQLRIVRETVRQNFNLTEVAEALFTSQPGVSKHIKDLEDELGVELFVRKGKRLIGLTEPGKELIGIVERLLLDAQNIKQLADQFTQKDQGQLVIATTHTQARYVLPKVVKGFKDAFPKVHLVLHQGSPAEIVSMLQTGQADIGIATEALDTAPEIATFPYYQWRHALIVPKGHPLASLKGLTLKDIAAYPIITYHEGYTGRGQLDKAFADEGLAPDIVMSALDADVIKAYVELGLGIGIVASMAYYAERDTNLSLSESEHLFRLNTTLIGVRRGHYLRGYAYKFIELCAAEHTEAVVRQQATQLA